VSQVCRPIARKATAAVALLSLAVVGLAGSSGCSSKESSEAPLATPSFVPSRTRAPLGSPIEVTYKFTVAPGAKFDQNYRVFVHFMDSDDELMWSDDHNPPTPTTSWHAGQTVEYTRTLFVPVYPYIGPTTVRMGLYGPGPDGARLPLTGQDVGRREYKVGTIELLPQSENIFVIFKDGWHQAEVAQDNPAITWQWTKKESTLAFKNPKRDVWFYLQVDGRPDLLSAPQNVRVLVGDQVIDTFAVPEREPVMRKVTIPAAQLGSGEMVEMTIDAGQSFVPAQTPAAKSADHRELGVRVFHAFVEAK
jgi:hypothetical protein